jgi:hypothetical protein
MRIQNSELRIQNANCGVTRMLLAILKGIVNELTDQAAYRRHLAAHGTADSPAEWRRFTDARWEKAAKRPKCC